MELDTIKVSGADAVEKLMALRSEFSSSGKYPFIIGNADELGRIQENAEFAEGEPTKDLDLASSFDLQAWLSTRKDDLGFEEFDESEIQGDWPGATLEKAGITAHTNIMNGRPLKEVYIGLVNISEPWQLPAVIQYGGWNDCPFPAEQSGIMRHWQQAYGAQIVSMTGDVVECHVERPPQDRDSAIELAWQQYWYCYDIVDQGCETVCNLGATLINSSYWYFWWD